MLNLTIKNMTKEEFIRKFVAYHTEYISFSGEDKDQHVPRLKKVSNHYQSIKMFIEPKDFPSWFNPHIVEEIYKEWWKLYDQEKKDSLQDRYG